MNGFVCQRFVVIKLIVELQSSSTMCGEIAAIFKLRKWLKMPTEKSRLTGWSEEMRKSDELRLHDQWETTSIQEDHVP